MLRRVFLIVTILFAAASPMSVFAQQSGITVREVNVGGALTNEYFNSTFRAGTDSYFTVPGNADIKILIPNGETYQKIYVYYQNADPGIAKSRLLVRFSADAMEFSAVGSVEHLNNNGEAVTATNQASSGAAAGAIAPVAQNLSQPSNGVAAAQTGSGVAAGSLTPAAAPATTVAKCGDSKGIIDPKCDLKQNLEHLYNISVPIIVLLAFLAVIYAGYIYITSFGQADRITEAKNWLLAAVGGIVLILLVPVILSFLKTVPLPGQ